MNFLKSIVLLLLTAVPFQSTSLLAVGETPVQTKINNIAAAKALLGTHKMTHQVISWAYFGSVTINNQQGIYYLKGTHVGRSKGGKENTDLFKINGQITEINNNYFKFVGTMTTQFKSDKNKRCKKTGTFYFRYRQGKSRSWRLLNEQHTCSNHVVLIDIYVNKRWAPRRYGKLLTQSEQWGIGLLVNKNASTIDNFTIPSTVSESMKFKILFPITGLVKLYDKPDGVIIGSANINVTGEKPSFDNLTIKQMDTRFIRVAKALLVERDNSVFKLTVHANDIVELRRNLYAVKVYDQRDGYLKVFPQSIKYSAWVSIADLNQRGVVYKSWRQYMLDEKKQSFYPSLVGINVRSIFNVTGKKLTTIKGKSYQIKLSGESKGNWLKVKVTRMSADCLKEFEEWDGWIKALDDKGFPNIWVDDTNC
ncbi:hypothetical protein MNBD_GAMMA12-3240 [hydrothermal vent metagenome]|uniref:Uncharacterized protein n=1 Tax=hydrothermal vent metagenome TaxID=652676 RepID=A0A3B0YHP8_9ZZZZ